MNSTAGEPRPDQAAAGAALPGPVISIRGLVKRYGSQEAVRGIDLDVHQGEIFAFLGPNGAGKTTTVEILEGFRQRSDGEVTVLGADPARAGGAWRDRVGVVLQESKPEPGLSVRECLELYAGFYSAPRDIDETITLVGLDDKKRTHADKLSGGQLRRLDFALALIGDPELIFLDEPTTGFDPSGPGSARGPSAAGRSRAARPAGRVKPMVVVMRSRPPRLCGVPWATMRPAAITAIRSARYSASSM